MTGETNLIKKVVRFGECLEDPFLDSYAQELFACHAIIDKMKMCGKSYCTVTFDNKFLTRILKSYILTIRKT